MNKCVFNDTLNCARLVHDCADPQWECIPQGWSSVREMHVLQWITPPRVDGTELVSGMKSPWWHVAVKQVTQVFRSQTKQTLVREQEYFVILIGNQWNCLSIGVICSYLSLPSQNVTLYQMALPSVLRWTSVTVRSQRSVGAEISSIHICINEELS